MGVALITPFKSDGSVDYNALVRLVEYQVQNGVDFSVYWVPLRKHRH